MAKKLPQVLDTVRVATDEGEHTLRVLFLPVVKRYAWDCDNGDGGTLFKTEADARADMDAEIAWLRGEV